MPTYEYRCPDGHLFEHFVRKISDSVAELPCPECGKMAARQLSAGGGLLFRGSGFYITDYGKDGKKPQTTPAAESGSSGSGDALKSEPGAKPEAKATEAKPAKEPKSADKKAADKSGSSGKAK